MPYINQEDREYLDKEAFVKYGKNSISVKLIEELAARIRNVPSNKVKGACNYTVSRIVAHSMKPLGGWTYSSLSDAIGLLRDAANEMERRLMVPYENIARSHNGDLPEYLSTDGTIE
jgi:hypothetical protein